MKRLLLVFLLLPLLVQADPLNNGSLGLAAVFEVFLVVSLIFIALLAALAFVSLRRPRTPGLLKWHGLLLGALTIACAIAALLQFFLMPLLLLFLVAFLLLVTTLARRLRES
jgi:threonine/homoserine/homoserine lactone efflux protein